MSYKMIGIIVVLAGTLVACGQASTPPIATPPAIPTPAGVPSPTAAMPSPTVRVTESAAADPDSLVAFEEPRGLFALRHPAGYSAHDGGTLVGDYAHLFVSPSGSGALVVSLGVGGEGGDEAPWQGLVQDRGLVNVFTSQLGLSFMEETSREVSPTGKHELLVNMASAPDAPSSMKGVIWVSEAQGTVAALIWALPTDEWDAQSNLVQPVIQSFSWEPDTVRDVLAPADE